MFRLCTLLLALAALPARAGDLPLSVHLYGFLNGEVEYVRALGGASPITSHVRIGDGNSRLGLAGTYSLSSQTDVNVQLEALLVSFAQGGINDLGQAFSLMSRNTFIGVTDKRFGALLIGFNDSAYRSLVGTGNSFGGNWGLTQLGLDLWNNTSAGMSGGVYSLFGRGEARMPNSLHYHSPTLFGVTVNLSYGLDQVMAEGGRRDHFSAAAQYKIGGFGIGVGYDFQANTGVNYDRLYRGEGMHMAAVNDVNTSFYKVLVSYTAPTRTYIGFGYERSVFGVSTFTQPGTGAVYTPLTYGTMDQGGAMLSLAQPIGDLTLMGSAGKLGGMSNSVIGSGADYNSAQFSIGAKYAFNDSFMTYLYFTRVDNGSQQNINLGVPIFSNNLGTTSAYLAPGSKPMAGGLGMIARF